MSGDDLALKHLLGFMLFGWVIAPFIFCLEYFKDILNFRVIKGKGKRK